MTKGYECWYHFKKDIYSMKKAKRLSKDLNRLRSLVIRLADPYSEKWNEEYKANHDPLNLKDMGCFLKPKFQKYIDKVNKSLAGFFSSIIIDFDPETCEFIGIDKKDDEQIVSITF